MSLETLLLTEIRDLLLVLAEPVLAKRDQQARDRLRKIVGKSVKGAAAVMLMDGNRSAAAICKECGTDKGYLSRLIKALASAGVVESDDGSPRLVLKLPPNFFDQGVLNDE